MSGGSLQLPGLLDTLAIIFGSLTGAMAATRRGMDWLGVFLVAFCTGVGGGLVRDVLLQNGVPALLSHPQYQLFAAIGAVVGLFFAKGAARFNRVYDGVDTLMIGVWVLLGASKAAQEGLGPISVVFVGTVAAIGGALLRDILCHDPPAMLRPGHYYTIAALAAAITYTALLAADIPVVLAQLAAIFMAAGLRFVSVKYDIRSPSPYDLSDKVLKVVGIGRHY